MPLIQVDLDRSLHDEHRGSIETAIHEAQIAELGIPANDRFQVYRPHEPGELRFDPSYNGVDRQALFLLQVTMVEKYDVATKQRFYRAVVDNLEQVGIRREDVLICVIENQVHDWYAGSLPDADER